MDHAAHEPITTDHEKCMLVLIDLQPSFLDAASGDVAAVLDNVHRLLLVAGVLGIPVVATLESPVDRKGGMPGELADALPPNSETMVKTAFNLCADAEARARLRSLGRSQCLVVGAETDVCVLQSVLGLLRLGYEVFLLEDCVISSTHDTRPALRRMYGCGAVPATFKSTYYELVRSDDVDERLRADPMLLGRGWRPPDAAP